MDDDITPVSIPVTDPDATWRLPTVGHADSTQRIPVVATDATQRIPVMRRAITAEYPVVATPGPVRRPPSRRSTPIVLRALAGIALFGAVAFGAVLMLWDRAPEVLVSVFGDRARSLWDRIDARAGLGGTTPPADTAVHIALWAGIVLLAGIAAWGWWRLIGVAAAAAIAGLSVEVAQDRWTESRAMEVRDVVANLVGIAAGVLLAGAVMAVWQIGSWLRRRA